MTLQVLKYFVAVAHYQNYTRAAQECYITQPALSRAIAGLEQELGCRLLERSTKRVALTPAGELCLRDAQEILSKCELLRLHAHSVGREQYRLRVGYMYAGYLPILSRRLAGNEGSFQLDTEYGSFFQLKRRLLDGELDILLTPRVNCSGMPELQYAYVSRSRLCVLLHVSHRLAGFRSIPVRELMKESFIAWDEEELPGANYAHCSYCEKMGFRPRYVAIGKKLGDIMMLVQRHEALALTSQELEEALPASFRIVPIQESSDQCGLACAWKADNPDPALLRLRQLLDADL